MRMVKHKNQRFLNITRKKLFKFHKKKKKNHQGSPHKRLTKTSKRYIPL